MNKGKEEKGRGKMKREGKIKDQRLKLLSLPSPFKQYMVLFVMIVPPASRASAHPGILINAFGADDGVNHIVFTTPILCVVIMEKITLAI